MNQRTLPLTAAQVRALLDGATRLRIPMDPQPEIVIDQGHEVLKCDGKTVGVRPCGFSHPFQHITYSAFGATGDEVVVKEWELCESCEGVAHGVSESCTDCNGEGRILVRCKQCSGSGKGSMLHARIGDQDMRCKFCNGSGDACHLAFRTQAVWAEQDELRRWEFVADVEVVG